MTEFQVPPKDQCVLPHIIARRAAESPEDNMAMFEDGTAWTNKEGRQFALGTATGLKALGIGKGDRVLCWLPNGRELLKSWFGINQLGAIYVPLNPAYRGSVLQHVVANAAAKVAIVHVELLDRLGEIDLEPIAHVVVVGGRCRQLPRVQTHEAEVLAPREVDPGVTQCPAEPWDPYAIIYTSGTTGPSKGVLSSYLHIWATGALSFGPLFKPGERVGATLPLFHAGGTVAVVGALSQDASFSMLGSFDTATFWDTIRRTGTTMCTLLGVMATFLLKQPEKLDDKDTPLRLVAVVPLTDDAKLFARRFGCEVFTCFNMTEISCPLMSETNPSTVGACGKPRPGVEVRLVDEHDLPVAVGQVGELIVRTESPWTQNSGYWRNPEATAAAWRNGWFHTGDAFRMDERGDFFFVDRIKDTIRRRGENISSFEVEAELLAYPAIKEAAAVAVRSDVGEDEVLAVVAPREGTLLDPAQLMHFLIERMPYFMVPRYVRVLPALPKTQTSKVEKHILRAQGVAPGTWDREAAGIKVRRERVGERNQA